MGGRIRLALLMLLLVSLPGAGIALAATGLGPDPVPLRPSSPATTSPAPVPSPVPSVAPSAREEAATGPEPSRTRKPTPTKRPASSTTARPSTRSTPAGSARSGSGSGPIRYGTTYHGVATFYAADGSGNCGYPRGGDLMVGAMNQQDYANSASCGAYLSVRAASGAKVVIRVTDRCPECPPGAIDLSREVFTRLAPAVQGRIQISWHLLSPALRGPVSYVYKDGSSRYWCGLQLRNHRNPVATVQLRAGGTWKTLTRAEYNYFLSEDGVGCGGTVRVTDIYGNRLVDRGIGISPGAEQPGHAQLPAR